MTEIWNLSTLCRCCHADGHFKSLSLSYRGENDVEIYENMLRNTLGVLISTPPLEASHTICDACIFKLREATEFKKQVISCEEKFLFYCKNEQFTDSCDVKSEAESETDFHHDYDIQEVDEIQEDEKFAVNVKNENSIIIEIPAINDDETKKSLEIPKGTLRDNENINMQKISTHKGKRRKHVNLDKSLVNQLYTHTGSHFSCKTCGALYQTKKEINCHINKNHPTLLKCEFCEKELKSVVTYKNHLKVHTGNHYQCNQCPKHFTTKQDLKDHLNSHIKIYKCDLCQKDFKEKQTLVKHLRVHAGTNKKILCHLCGRSFNDQSNLNAHTRTVHEKLRPFHCKICNKFYSNQRILRDHLKLHSGTQDVIKCDVCGRRGICPKTMEIHRLKHDGKFLCKFCPEIFSDSDLRREHLKVVHQKEIPWFPCTICGKVLAGKYSLNRHIDDHKGIKRFPCDICGLKFSQKSVLTRHMLRKHDSKADNNTEKTKCDICKRSYKNIVSHIMKNHENRSCVCVLCGNSYPNNSALNRHKALKHFGRSFDCDICEKKYLQKDKLKAHKLKVHHVKTEKEPVTLATEPTIVETTQADDGQVPMISGASMKRDHRGYF